MPQSLERIMASPLRLCRLIAMLVLVMGFAVPATPSFAQAAGHVRAKIVKGGLLVGGGAGSGVLTYRGNKYPFKITGMSFGITAGATIGRLDGWASGIREVGDFAGTYSSVGGGFALVGGISGVHLRNEKGVTIVMQGPKAGLELAANISQIMISLR
ncbi:MULTISPECIES: hypothetical protein [Bradyrhizobium]|uniref:DUF1134 domain-containing protein n=1 Tax=Bradyrhizobium ottawaense TaxID=931866 RepID=A0ABV4G0X6_9BRAD|nr:MULTISPECIES: hypothetical protein [Bradyrhizobium]MBR1289912.1 hypothetical protein [Bradyrhizobium ottawaense]MDA9418271.1 hypothetical protein [Bradyrhizobium sp. CCBAU 25360]MDA9484955.1 hypothetical protein [Bradyrhizobium sp. CCBAU 11445]PDT68269.1 hypothetical protein CO683_17665 [Bradyrhizobium ottawaense]WLB48966.1 hypothetical protein QIH93_13625 [Bradyrhizobium ottawaense]